jgi:hypothetical protein
MTKKHTNKRYGKELSDLSNELVEMGELVAGQNPKRTQVIRH